MEGVQKVVSMKLMKPTKNGTAESAVIPATGSAVTGSISNTWGWLPVLSLTAAVGIFLFALAYNAGRISSPWANLLFWCGIVVFFLPIAMRIISPAPARCERIALLFVLAIALYLVKFLQYPLYFANYDEFTHWRTAYDIAASGHLFQFNPLLPISSYYPGLEIATNALSSLTGLSIFDAGITLIGLTRLLFVLSLYLSYERFSNSGQVAGIATLLYMANSGFVSTDEMFSYESLALPLAAFVLFVVARRRFVAAGRRPGLSLIIWFGLGAVVITHHVTSYALVAFLLLWTVMWIAVSFRLGSYQKGQASPGGVALLGVLLCLGWLFYTGSIVVDYLAEPLKGALNQFSQILISERAPRQLLHSGAFVSPLWERMMSYGSEALIVLGLPFGLFKIWRYLRANAAALALALGAIAFPVAQSFRLTQKGAESADRSTEFLFLGVAFVLAIGIVQFWLSRSPGWRRAVIVVGAISVIFIGQLIIGTGPLDRLPGLYLVSADQRSIEPEGITAAQWMQTYLGPGHRVASDRINTLLLGTYGDEWVVTGSYEEIATWPLFLSPQFQSQLVVILQQDKLQYLVFDHRLSTGLPVVGTYFNKGEPDAYHYTQPIPLSALEKFDNVTNVSRIFDSGNIVIYDIEAIANGPVPTPTRTPPEQPFLCSATQPTTVPSTYPKLAKRYQGTIFDIPLGQRTAMSLSDILQQQGSICGSFSGLGKTGPFKGSITADGHIQFVVTTHTGQAILTFDGFIHSDGTFAGSYCHPKAGKCSDYGLWNLSTGP